MQSEQEGKVFRMPGYAGKQEFKINDDSKLHKKAETSIFLPMGTMDNSNISLSTSEITIT